MKRAYLDVVVGGGQSSGTGFTASCEEQVLALGGSWQKLNHWDSQEHPGAGTRIIVLIDVPDHDELTGLMPLDGEYENWADFHASLDRAMSGREKASLRAVGRDDSAASLRAGLSGLLEYRRS